VNYQVSHKTSYHYDDVVSASYGQIHLLPRDGPNQTCLDSIASIDPLPADQREHVDFFGNRFVYFEIVSPHRDLIVTTTSTVEVGGRQDHLSMVAGQPWEEARLAGPLQPEAIDTVQFVLDSPLASVSPEVAAYASPSFSPGRPVLEALVELGERIHGDLQYEPGATSVATTAAEALAGRAGVCQDLAHVMIACLRSLGLAARYVSGYIETDPPPGEARRIGADMSHAWAALLVPAVGWVDFDPTNRQLINDRYVTAAWGRDYRGIPPLKGVIFTDGTKHELEVSVSVVRV
jgi:transglutaminase-like putative cysteine protease